MTNDQWFSLSTGLLVVFSVCAGMVAAKWKPKPKPYNPWFQLADFLIAFDDESVWMLCTKCDVIVVALAAPGDYLSGLVTTALEHTCVKP